MSISNTAQFTFSAREEVARITVESGITSGILTDMVYTSQVLGILATIIISSILLKNSYDNAIQE